MKLKHKYYFHSANINTYSEALWNTKQISKYHYSKPDLRSQTKYSKFLRLTHV